MTALAEMTSSTQKQTSKLPISSLLLRGTSGIYPLSREATVDAGPDDQLAGSDMLNAEDDVLWRNDGQWPSRFGVMERYASKSKAVGFVT